MSGVTALLTAAAAGHILARWLRVPAIPLLLVAGVALAVMAPPEGELLTDVLVLGVAFLLFVVGLELDPRRTRAQRHAAIEVGAIQFLVLAALGFLAARVIGFGAVEAGYLALALTASSTLVGVRLLQRRQQMFEPFGRLVLGVLLLQDLLVLLSIPLVTELASGWGPALWKLAGIAAIGALSLAVRRWAAPLLLRFTDDEELLLLGSLALLFLFLAASTLLELPIVVGAFLAGVALSGFPVSGIVRAELAPIGDFFAALFFTALGALVRVPGSTQIWQAAVLVLVVVLVTPPLVTVIAERAGLSAKSAIEAGLLLSQTSEISLVIGLTGMIAGHIGDGAFTVIALVTLTTMLLTPVIATDAAARRLMHLHPTRRRRRTSTPPAGHVLLVGTGSTGMPLLEDLLVRGCAVAVVDDDPAVCRRLTVAGVRAIRGDASDTHVLEAAGAGRARAIASTIRRPRDNATLLELARDVPILVRVFDRHDAEWVRARGGTPVMYSEATADGLIEWFRSSTAVLEADLARRLAHAG